MKDIKEIEREIDSIPDRPRPKTTRHRRGIGIRRTTFVAIMTILVGTAMIGAGTILEYYGTVEITLNVEQSILINGEDYTTPVTYEFNLTAGCTECRDLNITNLGCVPAVINMTTTGTPDLEGITVTLSNISGVITPPFTIQAGETLWFDICYNLSISVVPGEYVVTTRFVPAI